MKSFGNMLGVHILIGYVLEHFHHDSFDQCTSYSQWIPLLSQLHLNDQISITPISLLYSFLDSQPQEFASYPSKSEWAAYLENLDDILANDLNSQQDLLGNQFQATLSQEERKKFAVNFTNEHIGEYLAELIANTFNANKHPQNIPQSFFFADPFCGSGRLILHLLNQWTSKISKNISSSPLPISIWIGDMFLESVIISIVRLLHFQKSLKINFKIIASIGDSFQFGLANFQKMLDIIISNPPYTRNKNVDVSFSKALSTLTSQFSFNFPKRAGLHFYALFLYTLMLKPNGISGAILPASTFQSQYSKPYYHHLKDNYSTIDFYCPINQKSFSDASDFREIIFLQVKRPNHKLANIKTSTGMINNQKVKFHRILIKSPRIQIHEEFPVAFSRLQNEWNWMKYDNPKALITINSHLKSKISLFSATDKNYDIIRGIEMFGSQFFFLPNKEWQIAEKTTPNHEKIFQISHNESGKQIKIEKQWLIPILRKIGNYGGEISPNVNDYVFFFPSSSTPTWWNDYQKSTTATGNSAKRYFGDEWYRHPTIQMERKSPTSHLFFVDKAPLSKLSNLTFFADEKLLGTKNFNLIRNLNYQQAKLLAAWFNSSLYLALYLHSRREIGGTYGRLQISDYNQEPLFLDVSIFDFNSTIIAHLFSAFDNLRKLNLPPIRNQLEMKERNLLDRCMAEALGFSDEEIPELLDNLYNALSLSFEELLDRD